MGPTGLARPMGARSNPLFHSALLPQCDTLFCTTYAPGTCDCTACEAGWRVVNGSCVSVRTVLLLGCPSWQARCSALLSRLPICPPAHLPPPCLPARRQPQPHVAFSASTLRPLQVNTVTLSANDPQFVQKARTVGRRERLIVTDYVLEGDTQPSTLELVRVDVWLPDAQIVIDTPTGPITRGPPDTRYFRGAVAGSLGSISVLTIRDDDGVTGLALRDSDSWALGKLGGPDPTLATAPLGSRKTQPEDKAGLPDFNEKDAVAAQPAGGDNLLDPNARTFTPSPTPRTAMQQRQLLQVRSYMLNHLKWLHSWPVSQHNHLA